MTKNDFVIKKILLGGKNLHYENVLLLKMRKFVEKIMQKIKIQFFRTNSVIFLEEFYDFLKNSLISQTNSLIFLWNSLFFSSKFFDFVENFINFSN